MGDWLGLCVLCEVGAVVAGGAVPRCSRSSRTGVAHGGLRKCGVIIVAGIALRRGWYMRYGFCQSIGKCIGTVVAGRAIA